MRVGYYWKLLTGKTKALNPAKIDLKHIWAVFQSWVRSLLPTPLHIREQIAWREKQVKEKSPLCWIQGHCIQCGCEIKGKIKADMECDNPPFCYPAMMKKKEWGQYKIDKGIYIYKIGENIKVTNNVSNR